ncbi:MAG: MutS N-terminal domain-containing protein, partial [Planctomycetota bacterium]
MAKSAQTPMMQQYMAFKKKHRDAILLFRMGDFYEVFLEDAKTCARDLGLALTSREKGAGAVPMAGFPHHAADNYIRRLIRAGRGWRGSTCRPAGSRCRRWGLAPWGMPFSASSL